LALRRVFAQDADFKESMFARQIAVMKGQAWNVVETLKQRDHGPLELTRRTRVCVWDDLVDVPVAIPMRTPSSEISRKRPPKPSYDQQEEMDIGVGSQESAPVDLLLGSPTSELPNPNRFELTRDAHLGDIGRMGDEYGDEQDGRSSPVNITVVDFADSQVQQAKMNLSTSLTLPPNAKGGKRFSFDFTRGKGSSSTKRQRSMSSRSGRRPDMLYEGDDLEGDLGYAAASDMEGHQRKVIVERLEAVKSKNPVFTWC
jgi:phosphatidylinositol 4-kinase type 2